MPAPVLAPMFSWRSALLDPAHGPRDYELLEGARTLTVRGSTQRTVALALSAHMSERGTGCFPSFTTLAAETQLARRTVVRAVQALRDTGWLERKRGGTWGGLRYANTYTARFPAGVREAVGAAVENPALPSAMVAPGDTVAPGNEPLPSATVAHQEVPKDQRLSRVHAREGRENERPAGALTPGRDVLERAVRYVERCGWAYAHDPDVFADEMRRRCGQLEPDLVTSLRAQALELARVRDGGAVNET